MINKAAMFILAAICISLLPSCDKGVFSDIEKAIDDSARSGKALVILFGSKSCQPCASMLPYLEALGTEHGEIVNVLYVDILERRGVAEEYSIRVMPTEFFYTPNGILYMKHEGYYSFEDMILALDRGGVRLDDKKEVE